MCTSQLFIVLVVLLSVISGNAFKTDPIHHYMDKQELEYYFGTESKFHVPHYEVVKIVDIKRPQTGNQIDDVLHFNLKAFDEEIFLKLKRNKHLVSPFMRFVEKSNETGESELNGRSSTCHYLHIDETMTAAVTGCYSNHDDIVRS